MRARGLASAATQSAISSYVWELVGGALHFEFSNNHFDSSLVRLLAMVINLLFIYIISTGLEKCRPRHPFKLYMLLALLGALGFFVLAQHPCYFHMPIGLTPN